MKKLLITTTAAIMTTLPGFAGVLSGVEIGIGVSGTTGLNGFVGYANKNFDSAWLKRFGVRVDFASTKIIKQPINSLVDKYMGDGFKVNDNLTIVDGTIDSEHIAALVDFYPFGDTWLLGGWRISGGYLFGRADIDAKLTGHDSRLSEFAGREFEIWGNKYKYSGDDVHGTAHAKWNLSGPYAGTGFDVGLFGGFKLFVDAGVVFTSRAAELSMNVPTDGVGLQYWDSGINDWKNIDAAAVDVLNQNIEKTLTDVQNELNRYKFFPIVKAGFMYRF